MDNVYWILALWVIVGLVAAVAFGFFTHRSRDNESSNSTVKYLGDFHRHTVTSAVTARRARPIPHGIKKSA